MVKTYTCDFCNKQFERQECYTRGKRHLFCSRRCLTDFSCKLKNPERYADLKDYTNMAVNFSNLAKRLNPTKMTPETRAKIRASQLGRGEGRTYAKHYGRHEHRIVAEQILGRPLKNGEVVHHLDGDKRNNSPENLRVFSSQAEHAWEHKALEAFFEKGEIWIGGDAT